MGTVTHPQKHTSVMSGLKSFRVKQKLAKAQKQPTHPPVVPPEAGVQAGLQLQAPSLAPHQAEHLSEQEQERGKGLSFSSLPLRLRVLPAFGVQPCDLCNLQTHTHIQAVRLAHHLPPLRQKPSEEQHATDANYSQ